MKLIKLAHLMALGAALSFAVVGCKHKPVGVTPLPNSMGGHPGDPNGGIPIGGDTNGLANSENPNVHPIADPSQYANWPRNESIFEADTVHFAYDSSVVRSEDKSKIAHVADYLKGNPNTALEVQGHCDERGTDEYNRALGERRALAVREELINLGVDASRVMTVSFGRQRPVDTADTEAAHAKNRRGAFVLLTHP
jgi:peptidoglycan-associated lipoprotein